MVRVLLPFRGVAVLLLAASTVVGQTPEPPAEFLSLDSLGNTTPDFLRQFSADPRHPLLSLMVDGELTSFDGAPAQDSSKLKAAPQQASAAPKTSAPESASEGSQVDDSGLGGGLDGGCEFGGGCGSGGCGLESMCPTVPNMLPFACAAPCGCRKCQRKCGHGHCGSCGNAYPNWSCCPACFSGGHHRGHKHCGGCGDYAWAGGSSCGWDTMDGGCGFCGCWTPPPCCGHKCHKHHNRCGCPSYGSACCGGYEAGWGMGCGGWGMEGGSGGCCMPAPSYCGHKCHRKHGCSNCCGNGGYLCPGWDDCGYGDGCGYGCGCSKHHCGRCHRHCQQPCCYPMMNPCMGMQGGMGMMSGMGWESCGEGGMIGGECGCTSMQGGMGY